MNTKINKFYALAILISLAGCIRPTTLQIEFENVAGLEEKSPVLVSGLKVGSVKDFKIQPDSKILVEVELDIQEKDLTLKKDAKFVISSLDILGKKGITIANGISNIPMDFQSVQQGETEQSIFDKSTIVNIMDKFSGATKLDTIVSELKKLNKNLEK